VVKLRGLGPVDLRGDGQCLCMERGHVGLGVLGLLEPLQVESCMRMQGAPISTLDDLWFLISFT
jgi:hypothetical protein